MQASEAVRGLVLSGSPEAVGQGRDRRFLPRSHAHALELGRPGDVHHAPALLLLADGDGPAENSAVVGLLVDVDALLAGALDRVLAGDVVAIELLGELIELGVRDALVDDLGEDLPVLLAGGFPLRIARRWPRSACRGPWPSGRSGRRGRRRRAYGCRRGRYRRSLRPGPGLESSQALQRSRGLAGPALRARPVRRDIRPAGPPDPPAAGPSAACPAGPMPSGIAP